MSIAPEILDSPDDVGRAAATQIADAIETASAEGRRFVLGCPSGRSPLTTYQQLALLVIERDLDLSGVVIVLMDEYVDKTAGGFRAVDESLPHSCVGFGRRDIVERLNAVAGPGAGSPTGTSGRRIPRRRTANTTAPSRMPGGSTSSCSRRARPTGMSR